MCSLNLVCRGDIAKALNESVTTIGHILNTRPHIQPVGKAGICRLYAGQQTIELVRIELEKRASAAIAT